MVNDLAKTRDFWINTLGFKLHVEAKEESPYIDELLAIKDPSLTTVKLIDSKRFIIELLKFDNYQVENSWSGDLKTTGLTHIALTVDNLDELVEILRKRFSLENPHIEIQEIEKPEFDYLKHLLDPERVFKDSSELRDEPSNRLDVKKIKNLLDLFPTKKAIEEPGTLDEEAQNIQKSKMLSGLVTLRNILDYPYWIIFL